jgi:osmoprotectant transport system ATP-binding protein
MSAIIEFRKVSYRIGDHSILRNIDLTIEEGETLVLLGRSGSGKTTLLKMVNALITPSEGSVVFQGKPTTEWDPIQLRRRIGYVIQDVGLFPHRTVEANVGLVPSLEKWSAGDIKQRVDLLLNRVGLAPETYARRYPRHLSGGQRQRVGVARALAADPPLLLLDEPFGALDPVTRVELQKQFISLHHSLGKTAVFVTHDVREAIAVGNRIALLHQGRIDVLAKPKDFLAAQTEEARAFLTCIEDQP